MIQPPGQYSQSDQILARRDAEQRDAQNHKKNRDVDVGQGRVILTDAVTGTRYALQVASGVLSVVVV